MKKYLLQIGERNEHKSRASFLNSFFQTSDKENVFFCKTLKRENQSFSAEGAKMIQTNF